MSDDIQFDKHIKDQLGNYSPPVPPDMWDKIVGARRKKKPAGIWALFSRRRYLLLFLLLISGGAAYWLLQQPVKQPAAMRNGGTPEAASLAAAPGPGAAVERQGGDASSHTNVTAEKSTSAIPPAAPPVTSRAVLPQALAQQPASVDDHITEHAPSQVASSGRRNSRNGSAASNDMAADNNNSSIYSPLQQPAAATGQPIRSKLRRRNTAVTSGTGGEGAPAEPVSAGADNLTARISSTSAYTLQPMLTPAKKLTPEAAATAGLSRRQLYDLLLPDCPSAEDNAAGNKRYFDVYAGPDLGLRSFSNFGTDTTSARYAQKRKESTRFQSAFSAGFRFTRVFSNGMSLRGGINYSQVNEKFEYVNEKDIRYILVVTPREIIGPGGAVTTIFDTVRYTETGKRLKTTYNRYRSIDIPLQIGYEFGNGRLHTNISAGAIINLYSWQRGDVLDTAYQPVSITTGKGSGNYGFRTNMGVGFLGSVSVYYKLTNRLHLMAEPYFRYNFQPMTNENLNITQKYNILGLRLGIRWDLK